MELKKLSEFSIELQSGKRPKGGVQNVLSGIPSLGAEHLNSAGGFKLEKIKFVPKEFAKQMKRGVVEKGDVIVVKDGATTGKVSFVGNDFPFDFSVINEHVFIVRVKEDLLPKFLFYKLFSEAGRKEILKDFRGAAQGGISSAFIEKVSIPVFTITEQERIVSKVEKLFSELDKGIEDLKAAQKQLKIYRQSVLKWAFEGRLTELWRRKQNKGLSTSNLNNEIKAEKEKIAKMTGKKLKSLAQITIEARDLLPALPKEWSWAKLGDHAFVTKLAGFEFTKYVKYKDSGEVPVIRAQNVSKTKFIPRNFLYVDKEIMEKLPRSRVHGGEILMVFVGAGLGNVGIVPENKEYFLGPNVAKIALEEQFDNKFVCHFLSSKLGFSNVTGMSKATAQGSISMANIREVSVPLLSLEEQKLIVSEIDSRFSVAEKMEESINESLQRSEALRQSILKKAFEGDLN